MLALFDTDALAMVNSEFATKAVYTPLGSVARALSGIFETGFATGASDGYAGAATHEAEFTVATAALPDEAAEGDAVMIHGTAYRVRVLEGDGAGLTRLMLEQSA